jgi:hypothetical protein
LANFGQFWDDFGTISGRHLGQIWSNYLDNFVSEFGPILGTIMGKLLGRFWSDFEDDFGDKFVLVQRQF